MRHIMTNFPKPEKCVGVSTTMSPVTHTADVAVNRASSGWVQTRSTDETGSVRSTVPRKMATR
jgi:hypothetical protein